MRPIMKPIKRKNCLRVSEALEKVKAFGFTDQSVRQERLEQNPVVTIHQNWTPSGREYASFRLAFGKWRGQDIGSCWRPKS